MDKISVKVPLIKVEGQRGLHVGQCLCQYSAVGQWNKGLKPFGLGRWHLKCGAFWFGKPAHLFGVTGHIVGWAVSIKEPFLPKE